jgi:hypothetical protein
METNIQKALQKRIVAHKEGKLHGAELLYQAILKSQPTKSAQHITIIGSL